MYYASAWRAFVEPALWNTTSAAQRMDFPAASEDELAVGQPQQELLVHVLAQQEGPLL
jgi:hypothetical protein